MQRSWQTQWYIEALADLHLVVPSACIYMHGDSFGPYLYSPGFFSDEGFWIGLQPFDLPTKAVGHRLRTPMFNKTRMEEVSGVCNLIKK
eukprot:4643434-Karenia_brevis.AAC.1